MRFSASGAVCADSVLLIGLVAFAVCAGLYCLAAMAFDKATTFLGEHAEDFE